MVPTTPEMRRRHRCIAGATILLATVAIAAAVTGWNVLGSAAGAAIVIVNGWPLVAAGTGGRP